MRLRSFLATALVLAASSLVVHADTLTYTESAFASGSLDGQNFVDTLVTLTATGSSSSVVNSGIGYDYYYYIVLPTELTVAGIGSTMFTDTIQFVSNETAMDAGVGDNTNGAAVLFTGSAVFSGYNLQSAIGPITGRALFNYGTDFNTAEGAFDITGASTSTFQAVASSPVPEPSTLALLGTGIIGLAGRHVVFFLQRVK